jgi:Putative metallopeptidase
MKKFSKLFLILLTFIGLLCISLYFVPDSWISQEEDITKKETSQALENQDVQEEALENPITLSYKTTSQYEVLKEKYQKIELLESIFASLGGFIKLPGELTAEYSECGEENAFYDPETQKITLCYEIIEWVESISKESENPHEVANNILTFFTLHEVGHALIDLYELPITGREEDVADQLATFFLLGSNDAGALDTADSFYSDIS